MVGLEENERLKNPRGTAIIYVRYQPKKNKKKHKGFIPGRFYAAYVTMHSIDLAKHYSNEEIETMVAENADKINDNDFWVYDHFVFNSRKEISRKAGNEDVIALRRINTPSRIIETLDKAVNKYIKAYLKKENVSKRYQVILHPCL